MTVAVAAVVVVVVVAAAVKNGMRSQEKMESLRWYIKASADSSQVQTAPASQRHQ